MTAWIWAPLWKAGSVTFAGVDGRTNHLCLFLCPGPFPSLVPVPCPPCGPPHLSRPVSGPPRSAAAAPLLNAPSPSLCLYPSLPDKTFPSPLPGMSSVGVWSWTGYWRQQTGGGEVTASGRMAGNIPLYENHREGAGRAREAQGAPGAPGKGWSTSCLEEGGSHHEHAMPTAEPSADCWDLRICMQGQRSERSGLDSLTGRGWSLPGRHRCGVDVG